MLLKNPFRVTIIIFKITIKLKFEGIFYEIFVNNSSEIKIKIIKIEELH